MCKGNEIRGDMVSSLGNRLDGCFDYNATREIFRVRPSLSISLVINCNRRKPKWTLFRGKRGRGEKKLERKLPSHMGKHDTPLTK